MVNSTYGKSDIEILMHTLHKQEYDQIILLTNSNLKPSEDTA
jgi:hypothetical protein